MKYHIITSFNQAGMQQYGQRMVDAFDRHWPKSIELTIYAEDCNPQISSDRMHVLDLMSVSADLAAFKKRYQNNPMANGKVAKDTGVPFKDNAFKWDAVRFSHKVFAVIHACCNIPADWVIWLDADTMTFADIPECFLDEICKSSAMACYLGRREKYHSECGWVAYNRNHPDLVDFIQQWKNLYISGKLFDLREYHDSFVFDVLRKDFQSTKHTQFYNLSPDLPGKGPGHPFIASQLGLYMDHMKGSKRKALGHSLPDDYDRNQGLNATVEYWKSIFNR